MIKQRTRNQKNSIIEEAHLYNILLDSREIFINGDSDEVYDSFLKNLRLLEQLGSGPIVVHQHSLGGCFGCGISMYDAIIHSPCHIIFLMYGYALSMGSIVPQAADTRIIMPSCYFMIHDGYTGINEGLTHKQSQSTADIERKIREYCLDIYTTVCQNGTFFQHEQMDDKQVREYLLKKLDQKEDWWLDSRETVRYGFADGVFGDSKYENLDVIKNNLNE